MWWEMGEVPAEELGRSLTLGREGLSGLPHHKKTGPKWIWKGLVDLSTMSNGSTPFSQRWREVLRTWRTGQATLSFSATQTTRQKRKVTIFKYSKSSARKGS